MGRKREIEAEALRRSKRIQRASRGWLQRYGRLLYVLSMVLASASFAILLIPEHRLEVVEAASVPAGAAPLSSEERASGGLMCPNPTATPTRRPRSTPTAAPTATLEPTVEPTPTLEPTVEPTPPLEPTAEPTPTLEPTVEPTPTLLPTVEPTPTLEPIVEPTPTSRPPHKPTNSPDQRGQIDVSPSQPSPSPTVDASLVFLLPETGGQRQILNKGDLLAFGGALALLLCSMLVAMERRVR